MNPSNPAWHPICSKMTSGALYTRVSDFSRDLLWRTILVKTIILFLGKKIIVTSRRNLSYFFFLFISFSSSYFSSSFSFPFFHPNLQTKPFNKGINMFLIRTSEHSEYCLQ